MHFVQNSESRDKITPLVFVSLAGSRQVFFGILETSHFLHEQGSKLGTLGIVDVDLGAPVAHVKSRLGSHAAGHAGHEPRVAVLGILVADFLRGMEAIVPLAQGVLEVVARAESLGTQNVVQVQALVAAYGGCGWSCVRYHTKRKTRMSEKHPHETQETAFNGMTVNLGCFEELTGVF